MSRKRDTNWSRDEITILLDSIMEITRLRAADGKRTNSKEVFEYAARKMGEKGHQSRAEREKCRTKWKKMKEEFTHAKRARLGDTRYKEAPGIQPFYDRMEEFINGNYDNISPHSTIVRRTSSLSNSSSSNSSRPISIPMSPEKRASARIAATHATTTTTTTTTANGTTSLNDNHDTSTSATTTTIVTRANTTTNNEYPSSMHTTTPNHSGTPPSRLNSRSSSGSNNNSSSNSNSNTTTTTNGSNSASSTSVPNVAIISATNSNAVAATTTSSTSQKPQERTSNQNGELCIYTSYNEYSNSNSASTTGSSHVHSGSNDLISASPPDQADISYRVSSGCRQITIFGDHDVDIKFRRDRVTINKIDGDYQTTETT